MNLTQLPGSAYADESAAIRDAAEDIGTYLAVWSMRDDAKPDAAARRGANEAMDAIDRALRELHALRGRLVSDIRQADDATAARVDALLAERGAADVAAEGSNDVAEAAVRLHGAQAPAWLRGLAGGAEGNVRATWLRLAGEAERLLAGQRDARAACLAVVTADENGEHPGDVEQAAGSLPWTLSDDGKWRAQMLDGRTAVIERLAGDDNSGHAPRFLPRVHESALDFEEGPECAGVLGAAAWCAQLAGGAR